MRSLDREPDQEPREGWKRGMRFHKIQTGTARNADGDIVIASFAITEQGGGGPSRVVTMTVEKDGGKALDKALGGVAEHDVLHGVFNDERAEADADVWRLQMLRKALAKSHAGLPEALRPTE